MVYLSFLLKLPESPRPLKLTSSLANQGVKEDECPQHSPYLVTYVGIDFTESSLLTV